MLCRLTPNVERLCSIADVAGRQLGGISTAENNDLPAVILDIEDGCIFQFVLDRIYLSGAHGVMWQIRRRTLARRLGVAVEPCSRGSQSETEA